MSDQTAAVSVKCLFVYGLFVRFVDHKNNIIFKRTYYLKQKQLLSIYVGYFYIDCLKQTNHTPDRIFKHIKYLNTYQVSGLKVCTVFRLHV